VSESDRTNGGSGPPKHAGSEAGGKAGKTSDKERKPRKLRNECVLEQVIVRANSSSMALDGREGIDARFKINDRESDKRRNRLRKNRLRKVRVLECAARLTGQLRHEIVRSGTEACPSTQAVIGGRRNSISAAAQSRSNVIMAELHKSSDAQLNKIGSVGCHREGYVGHTTKRIGPRPNRELYDDTSLVPKNESPSERVAVNVGTTATEPVDRWVLVRITRVVGEKFDAFAIVVKPPIPQELATTSKDVVNGRNKSLPSCSSTDAIDLLRCKIIQAVGGNGDVRINALTVLSKVRADCDADGHRARHVADDISLIENRASAVDLNSSSERAPGIAADVQNGARVENALGIIPRALLIEKSRGVENGVLRSMEGGPEDDSVRGI